MLTLQEKKFWDIIMSEHIAEITVTQIVNYECDSADAAKIIKGGINNNLFKNVKDINELCIIWEWLHTTCTQIEQGVVYAELHSLLLYLITNKVLRHKKPINTHFNEIFNLVKKIKAAVSAERDVWDDIVLITLLESLHQQVERLLTNMSDNVVT